MKRLDGKTALITGASSGIGRAIARKFVEEGATLLLMDVTETVREGGEPTHEILKVPFFQGDVSSEADAEEAVRRAAEPTGRLDILVNDAVFNIGGKLADTRLEDWNRTMAVNLTGVFLMCRAAIHQMQRQVIHNEVRGRIVNISSQHGMIASPGDCAYGVSKAGAVYMTRQIAADYAKDLIICNAVAPGKIVTGKPGIDSDPARLAYSKSRTPWPRLGQPNDVANAALYLASDLASYVTGTNLMVDGGWMAA
jgi:NAD(P)-dependent dehydrogenase (short-subunit alcohol dehydrogenase family)